MTKLNKILLSIIAVLSIIIITLLTKKTYREPSVDEVDYQAAIEIIKAYNSDTYQSNLIDWEVTEDYQIIITPKQ